MAMHVSLVCWGIPTGVCLCHTCMWSCLCALVSVGTGLVFTPASTLTLVCFVTAVLTREAGSLKWFQRTFLWCKDVENLGNIYWPCMSLFCHFLSLPIHWQDKSLIQCFTFKKYFLYFSIWSIYSWHKLFTVSIFCLLCWIFASLCRIISSNLYQCLELIPLLGRLLLDHALSFFNWILGGFCFLRGLTL